MGSDLSKPKSMKRFSFRRSKQFKSKSTDTISNKSIAKSIKNSIIASSNKNVVTQAQPQENIVITHRYPRATTTMSRSVPTSPQLYSRLNDTIVERERETGTFSPFYYDYSPATIVSSQLPPDTSRYVTHSRIIQQPKHNTKRLIYNTNEINKYPSYERVLEIRPDHSPMPATRSRIYTAQDIYQSNPTYVERHHRPPRYRIIDAKSPTTFYSKNNNNPATDNNVIYVPSSPNMYYNSQNNILESMNKNNIYVYDDIQPPPLPPTTPRHQIYSRNQITSPVNKVAKLQPSARISAFKNDDEIIYVPMKRSEFLRAGTTTRVSTSDNKIDQNNNSNEYIVLKEKTIKKGTAMTTANSAEVLTYESHAVISQPQQHHHQQDSLKNQQPQNVITHIARSTDTLTKSKSLPNDKNNIKTSAINKNLLDPGFYKRYQLTPTDSNQSSNDVKNTKKAPLVQKESSSKVIQSSYHPDYRYPSPKPKNPITELFDFTRRRMHRIH